ncbi:MAG TPA: hypothetical protein VMF09_10965 [Solirubrobacteraceae bacterium]|nr:hypothetical protein [Solirubrobacteraceae bacterium]
MTGRDRIVVMLVGVVAVLAAVWIEVVSPERGQASKVSAQVEAAKSQLASAKTQLSGARAAQSQYAQAYAAMVNLGKAVPPSDEVPSLIEQLSEASKEKNVDFASIVNSAASGSSPTAGAAGASGTAAGAAGASGSSLTDLPFTFSFEGSYFDLEHLFRRLTDFATLDSSGNIEVSGRLLTIESVSLTPQSTTTSGKPSGELIGAITASAYVLPASQGLSGSSSSASPAGAGAGTASGAASTSSPTSPAVVRVNP